MPITLTDDQVEFYRRNGYLALPGVLPAETLQAIRDETDRIVAGASALSESDDTYDLEDSHTPEKPRVRRIKNANAASAVFNDFAFSEFVAELLRPVLGPHIRLHHG